MAVASHIHLIGGVFQAELNSNDRHQLVGLDKLAQAGITAHSNTRRHTLITNFAEWEEIDPSVYARHFGIDIPSCAHQVFLLRHKRRRFIVPALALMRALFRPNRDVLAAMFLPQCLDRFSTPPSRVSAFALLQMGGQATHMSFGIPRYSRWPGCMPFLQQIACAGASMRIPGKVGLGSNFRTAGRALSFVQRAR